MTDDEGLSMREIAEWCGGSARTVREVTRLANPHTIRRAVAAASAQASAVWPLAEPSERPSVGVISALCVSYPPCPWDR